MNKHDLQQYAGIIVLCLGIVSGLYAFTAYIDRKADNHYAKQFNSAKNDLKKGK